MEEILVIDIGGTKTNVSFVASESNILISEIFPTCSNPDLQIQKIVSIYNEKDKKINSLSLSLPGKWSKNGILEESFSLPDWLKYPFVENLSKGLRIKNVFWETDVICAGLGEYNYLKCKNKTLLYINLGTGIGASLIKDDKPYKANSKLILRLQNLVLPFEDEIYSGVDLLSGKSLLKASGHNSIEALYHDCNLGKVEALDVILKAQIQLAAWLINLFYLFAPDVIVLGGGLTNDWDVLAGGAIDIANEELENQIEILPSKLREKAPIQGAYLNFKCHCEEQSDEAISLR